MNPRAQVLIIEMLIVLPLVGLFVFWVASKNY